ncbi:small ubiquitin-related modifier 2 isoform X1 [Myxocyprinus asiaticus]|uniref:small ubiquitin-related modifier 2 isoform X1 n=1 Tax=Myxocyprinus asiaticus TaxID=70543 RepID=UPI002222979C|nr:small ubiquitin-related modifier 2 isoform X1 [Myxocyprinus asiaticus]
MADEKPKEGVKTENNDHINLKVAGQDGSVVQFKIKRHTPLSKLMKAYCERQGLTMRQIRFRFDGQPINETDTPAQKMTTGHDRVLIRRSSLIDLDVWHGALSCWKNQSSELGNIVRAEGSKFSSRISLYVA